MKRGLVLSLCAAALAACGTGRAIAQQAVTLSLDIFYANAQDNSSGGAWQLIAKTSGNQGIAGVFSQLTGISTTAGQTVFMAPQPQFQLTYVDDNGTPANTADDVVKPWNTNTDGNATTMEMLFGQVPVAAPGPQNLVYGVGQNAGAAGSAGADELETSVFSGGADMTNGVLLAIGRFGNGQTPAFGGIAPQANVFTAQGTGTNPPALNSIVQATVTPQTRNNAATLAGDANLDKAVNLNDLTILGTFFNQSNKIWQQGDFNGDLQVNLNDLTVLGTFFNQSAPAAGAVGAVPEPSTVVLLGFAGLGLRCLRRRS